MVDTKRPKVADITKEVKIKIRTCSDTPSRRINAGGKGDYGTRDFVSDGERAVGMRVAERKARQGEMTSHITSRRQKDENNTPK